MIEIGDANAPCEAEIVDPAEPAGPSGRLLTRGQVARRLGTSLSTVRRMEGEQLKPIIGPRGVHYFEETEIQAVFVRVRRARMPDRAPTGRLRPQFSHFSNAAPTRSLSSKSFASLPRKLRRCSDTGSVCAARSCSTSRASLQSQAT